MARRYRFHRSRIGLRTISDRGGLVEARDEAAQSDVRSSLIPVIEDIAERTFVPDGGEHCAQDDRHPQQHRKASAEVAAAERREGKQYGHSHAKADDHPA